ncbi:transposase [Kibdelosporangium persicum]|uniref:transposase n=1 Tax=Kibdelosporangium persicum TaxID=2698649 RepID=UPI001566C0A7|nr:transposase [Kibdelosporangium persicum]
MFGRERGESTPWIVSDDLWEQIEPLLPVLPRPACHPGRKRLPDRQMLYSRRAMVGSGRRIRRGELTAPLTVDTDPATVALTSLLALGFVHHEIESMSTVHYGGVAVTGVDDGRLVTTMPPPNETETSTPTAASATASR